MLRPVMLTTAALLLVARLALADPALTVAYPEDIPRLSLAGDFANACYEVKRASTLAGPFETFVQQQTLCLGECFAVDRSAAAGATYYYRFDLTLADGTPLSFGPYQVDISAALGRPLRVAPNPVRGATEITARWTQGAVFGPGETRAIEVTVRADLALFDMQGRRTKSFLRGPITIPSTQGQIQLRWSGDDDSGRPLEAGVYFLRFQLDGRVIGVTRVLRVR